MTRGYYLTEDQLEIVRRAFLDYRSASDVARQLGCSDRVIYGHYRLLKHGIELKVRERPLKKKEPIPRERPTRTEYQSEKFGPPTKVGDWYIDADGCRTRQVTGA